MSWKADAAPTNLRQVHWVVVSQGLNTGTNFLLTVLVARGVSAGEFGAFAMTMLLYMLGVGVVRASCSDVLSILYSGDGGDLAVRAPTVVSFAGGLGIVLGIPCLGVGLLVGGSLGPYVMLAAAFPFIFVQDALRGLAFAQGRPRDAAVNDGLWVTVQTIGVFVFALGGSTAMPAVVGAWAAGGVVAAVTALVRGDVMPVRQAPHRWFVTNHQLAAPLLMSYALVSVPASLALLLMPVVTEMAELGRVRAAYLFFGPLGILILCLRSTVLPDAARLDSPQSVHRLVIRVTLALCAVAVIWGTAAVLLPDGIGLWILGENWNGTFIPRVFLAVSVVAEAALVGAIAVLGTFRLMARVVRMQIATAPLILVFVLVLAHWYGASGAAAGFAVSYGLIAVLAWLLVPSDRRLGHIRDQAMTVSKPTGTGTE